MKNMNIYIYNLFMALLAVTIVTSCTDEEGTEPGNDSTPIVTVYQYKASRPNNPDNDIILRFAANSKTTEAYYLVEQTVDKDAHIASMGKNAYIDYVVSNGIKVNDISGASNVDVVLTDLYGEYTITAVAVGKDSKTSTDITFSGLAWTDVVTGTYYFFNAEKLGISASNPTVLQVCTTDANLYRFKDVFGTGYHLKINLIDYKGSDTGGEYQFFRVPATDTPYIFGNYGTVNVRDIGYFQNNDAFVTEGGYESGMYSNYNCFIYVQYYVSAGNLGYDYDEFIAD